jgi:hypothetical protein
MIAQFAYMTVVQTAYLKQAAHQIECFVNRGKIRIIDSVTPSVTQGISGATMWARRNTLA